MTVSYTHLDVYKRQELSKDSPIKEVLPKGDMVYPVSQHIGAPAKPCLLYTSTGFIRQEAVGNMASATSVYPVVRACC